jgi:crotonobetainyl-CoA:carnitine CoA-transferase CaiB-like acyl-CoA transferase
MTLLAGLRVLDLSTEIAGPYATKLLADAGAEVIKVEPPGGDPLRAWSASHTELGGRDGALFQFLNTSKRSVVGSTTALVDGADVIVEDGTLTDGQIAALATERVVVSITPFGRAGGWMGRPATEFTLQALCGSTASRGTRDREPLHAGGRLGEWIAGAYTAVAALAALEGGRGEHVDVSMLECMAITLGGYNALHASLMGVAEASKGFPGPFRTTEVPSIEPTRDGLVGLCTVTGQQLEDLLLLIGQPELRGDERFATAMQRTKHAAEFEALLHAWTTARTTDEVIEEASALRVPVAPIGRPEAIAGFEQFVVRDVYAANPGGGFAQPRPPFRVTGVDARPFSSSPALGADQDATWPDRAAVPTAEAKPPGRPLDGIRVVDLTAFWAGPSASSMLAALGADVIKVESVQRPDGMRFSSTKPPGEPGWWEWSAVFQANNANKRGITLDLGSERGRELALELIALADVVVENFSPRVLDGFGVTWDAVHARNPRAIMARMPAFGLDGPWRDRTGFAQTMEQVSGMAWLTGFPDRPPIIPRGACDPLAGMHAVFAILAALAERRRSGEGRHIEVTMVEAALNVAAELVIEHSAYGKVLSRDGNRGPVAAPQGLYACAGTERWLALAVRTDEQWSALCDVLGTPEWLEQRADHDAVDALLSAAVADRDLDDLVQQLATAGVPAAPVLGPLAVLDLEPLQARGFVEQIDGPVVGRHPVLGVPFRFASWPGPWFESPAPTLGQHNRDVLAGLLGLDEATIAELAAAKVIGERPGA